MITRKILAFLRRFRTLLKVFGRSYIQYKTGLHVGEGTRLWAPHHITIGQNVYIGKQVCIEANCTIGDNVLIANRVGIVGRNDHDINEIGVPIRFASWIASQKTPSPYVREEVLIEDDVWIGYGCILLTGVIIGKGSIVAAGSVVTKNIPPYSIVAGVPGRVIRKRFSDVEIEKHERLIRKREFVFSEEGFDYFKIIELAQSSNQSVKDEQVTNETML